MLWMFPLLSSVFLAAGLAAYASYAKPRIVTIWPSPTIAFGGAWFGAGAILMFPLALADETWRVPTFIIGLFGAIGFYTSIVSIFWLPRRLLPSWYTNWVAGGRSLMELYSWSEHGRGRRSS